MPTYNIWVYFIKINIYTQNLWSYLYLNIITIIIYFLIYFIIYFKIFLFSISKVKNLPNLSAHKIRNYWKKRLKNVLDSILNLGTIQQSGLEVIIWNWMVLGWVVFNPEFVKFFFNFFSFYFFIFYYFPFSVVNCYYQLWANCQNCCQFVK